MAELRGNENQLRFCFPSSPRPTEPAVSTHSLPGVELPDAFLGTPITKLSQKCSRYSRSNDFIFQKGIFYHVYTHACVYAFFVYQAFCCI